MSRTKVDRCDLAPDLRDQVIQGPARFERITDVAFKKQVEPLDECRSIESHAVMQLRQLLAIVFVAAKQLGGCKVVDLGHPELQVLEIGEHSHKAGVEAIGQLGNRALRDRDIEARVGTSDPSCLLNRIDSSAAIVC